MINFEGLKNEKALRTLIKKNLNKEIHASTKPSIDFIFKSLEDAYNSGMFYDVSDMRNAIISFAANSSNKAETCLKIVKDMKFKSDDISEPKENADDSPLVFYDVEVFPNLFLVVIKPAGESKAIRLFNPTPREIEDILKLKLVGFNCRRYDNHILYACLMGYTNEQIYNLSQRIIKGKPGCFFGEAYNISYTDVFDFSSEKNR